MYEYEEKPHEIVDESQTSISTTPTYEIPEDASDETNLQTKTFIKEADELKQLINKISTFKHMTIEGLEQSTNRITQILEQYQEQSNLLDVHLSELVGPLIESIRSLTSTIDKQIIVSIVDNQVVLNKENIEYVYRVLYVLTKVRGFKTIVKLLPHSVNDLMPVVSLLEYKTNLYYQQTQRREIKLQGNAITMTKSGTIVNNGIIEDQLPQDEEEIVSWEEVYILSLWLSLLIIIPFKFPSIDGHAVEDYDSVASRLIRLSKQTLSHPSKFQDSFCELLSKLLTRPDMNKELSNFIEYSADTLKTIRQRRKDGIMDTCDTLHFKGLVSCLTSIFKKAQRQTLLPLNDLLFHQILSALSNPHPTDIERMCKKKLIKLLQRMALIILPPINATWKYQRVIKPLLSKQQIIIQQQQQSSQQQQQIEFKKQDDSENNDENQEEDDYEDIPDEIEDIIEVLISQGLSDRDTIVRWSSAKGIGRVVNLLPKDMGDQVISTIFDLFDDEQSDSQWHGGCLAMAELCRRGLILPERLEQLVDQVVKALKFDVLRGTTSVGSHVRDAACYISWALARTYHPSIMSAYSLVLAQNLVVTALLDREINCRKSASAAYQENVGRQGAAIPHGIDIVQLADYFAVGNRRNSYLELTPTIAAYSEYQKLIIDSLITSKIYHWDNEIRELAAKSLSLVLPLNPSYIIDQLPTIIKNTKSDQISIKHGSLLALHDILISLKSINQSVLLTDDIINNILVIIKDKRLEKLYKGKGGVYIRTGLCKLISAICMSNFKLSTEIKLDESTKSSNASLALRQRISALRSAGSKLSPKPDHSSPTSNEIAFDTLLHYLEESIQHPQPEVQKEASLALKVLFSNYMIPNKTNELVALVRKYHKILLQDVNPPSRRGASLLLGIFPYQLHRDFPQESLLVIDGLVHSLFEEKPLLKDMETRVNSLYSIQNLIEIFYQNDFITQNIFERIYNTLLLATEDYTIDKRGDVGSWVRDLACKILYTLIELDIQRFKNKNEKYINNDIIIKFICKLIQISGEKLDKLRLTSCTIITKIIWIPELMDYIPNICDLQSIFTKDIQITWSRSNEAFPIICSVLSIDCYLYYLVFGLFSSIGGPSKYLVDDALYSIQLYFSKYQDQNEKQIQVDRVASTFKNIIENTNKERSISSTFRAISKLFETKEFDICRSDIVLTICIMAKDKLLLHLQDIILLLQSIPLFSYFSKDIFSVDIKRIANEMLLFLLGNNYPKVRMLTAEELQKRYSLNEELIKLLTCDPGWDQDIKYSYSILNQIYKLFNIENPNQITSVDTVNKSDPLKAVKDVPKHNLEELPEDSEDLMEI